MQYANAKRGMKVCMTPGSPWIIGVKVQMLVGLFAARMLMVMRMILNWPCA